MNERHNFLSYIVTIAAIVIMTFAAVAIVLGVGVKDEVSLGKIITAIGFIAATITGLIGIAGTFKGRQSGMSDEMAANLMNKVEPTPNPQPAATPTEGTAQ